MQQDARTTSTEVSPQSSVQSTPSSSIAMVRCGWPLVPISMTWPIRYDLESTRLVQPHFLFGFFYIKKKWGTFVRNRLSGNFCLAENKFSVRGPRDCPWSVHGLCPWTVDVDAVVLTRGDLSMDVDAVVLTTRRFVHGQLNIRMSIKWTHLKRPWTCKFKK